MINKVILLGNVGQDPEVIQINDYVSVANFSVATTDSYKDKDGNWIDQTEWHTIKAYGKIVEFIEKHIKKGDHIYLEGMAKTDKWQDKDGNNRYSNYVCVNKFEHTIKKLKWDKKNDSVPPNTVTDDPLPQSDTNENNDEPDDLPF